MWRNYENRSIFNEVILVGPMKGSGLLFMVSVVLNVLQRIRIVMNYTTLHGGSKVSSSNRIQFLFVQLFFCENSRILSCILFSGIFLQPDYTPFHNAYYYVLLFFKLCHSLFGSDQFWRATLEIKC